MVPATVSPLRFRNAEGALTAWVDLGMSEAERLKKQLPPPNPATWSQKMANVVLFDNLIYNIDRHSNNIYITKDWDIILIDHSRSSGFSASCGPSPTCAASPGRCSPGWKSSIAPPSTRSWRSISTALRSKRSWRGATQSSRARAASSRSRARRPSCSHDSRARVAALTGARWRRSALADTPPAAARLDGWPVQSHDADRRRRGDVHGGYDQFVKILQAARVIDGRQRWSAAARYSADRHLVDRGADSKRVLDLLRRLEGEAERAGGRVVLPSAITR